MIIFITGEPQIVLGTDKAFTFDYVFDVHTPQVDVYSSCVERLVDGKYLFVENW